MQEKIDLLFIAQKKIDLFLCNKSYQTPWSQTFDADRTDRRQSVFMCS